MRSCARSVERKGKAKGEKREEVSKKKAADIWNRRADNETD